MKDDFCRGCPHNLNIGGEPLCIAPNGCEKEQTNSFSTEYNDRSIPSDIYESIISGLLDE